ncbi:MAG: outer membrane beta-barrel protein [Cyclobacteriaceae bacterium]|nr:outer membrane beta-barrel protein [Cyclobacteriaceae bacterium]
MKTLVPLLLLTISIHVLVAQNAEPVESISKGTKFIGGSFSFYSTKTDETFQYTDFLIGPGMGFYIEDNLAVGGFLTYNFNKSEQPNTGDFTSFSGFGLNMFLLKNYKIANNLFFTLQPQLSFNFGEQEYSNPFQNDYSSFSFGLGVSPGVMFFVSRKFALQTSLGSLSYSHTRRKPENGGETSTTNSFGLNGALSVSSFSIRYFIW